MSDADAVLSWLDGYWEDEEGLLGYPSAHGSPTNPYQRPGVAIVRESASYALGLLRRDAPGDRERAGRAIDAVLAHQVHAPGSVVHGTWRRSPLEPVPGPEPREWIDYDPNWREFIGTAFALCLDGHAARLGAVRVRALEGALRGAAEGARARAVSSEYTNIALMSAFLLDFVGERLGRTEWREFALSLAESLAEGYARVGAFPEHNSPTYYGIDLYGLALWRARAPSDRLRVLGAELEAAFWRDLARFYHAGLRNQCGPYTRAYGMDMTRYVATLGQWIAPVVGEAAAPLPPLGPAVAHAHDLCETILVAELGSRPPKDVLPALRAFPGEHFVEQVVVAEPRRVATAWLGPDLMIGGEQTGGRWVHWQHHPATAHWRRPDGGVGWLRVVSNAPIDATAGPGRLAVAIHTGSHWLRETSVEVAIEVEGAAPEELPVGDDEDALLPGLRLRLQVEPVREGQADGGGDRPARTVWRFPPGQAPERLELEFRLESIP